MKYLLRPLTVIAVLVMLAACSQSDPTSPQLETSDSPMLSAVSGASDFPGSGAFDPDGPAAEREYSGEEGPFEVRMAGRTADLFFRFNKKVRARESVSITLRVVPNSGSAVPGKVRLNFGDGRNEQTFDILRKTELEYTYRDAGSFRVFAIFESDAGETARGSFRIRVGEPLRVNIELEGAAEVYSEKVTELRFSATELDTQANRPVTGQLSIEFGNGTTENVKNFDGTISRKIVYPRPGMYTLSLVLTANGREFPRTFDIEVTDEPDLGADALDPSQITLVGHLTTGSAPSWPVTSIITVGAFREGFQTWSPNTGFPATTCHGGPCEGNMWFVRFINGRWEGKPMEWVFPGGVIQYVTAHHIHGFNADDVGGAWGREPLSGEEMYFFLATPSMDSQGGVNSRTNIVRVRWGQ